MQNEGKFNDKSFTVVVQPFATEYTDAYVDVSFFFWNSEGVLQTWV